jgi:Flp pilus assembly protein TadD
MPDPDLLPRLAEAALAAGRADIAGDILRAAEPPPADSHADGLRLLVANRPAEAERLLRLAVRVKPTDADRHDHLGVCLAQQGRLAEARATFRLAVRLDPTNAAAVEHLVQACLDAGDPADAEVVLSATPSAAGWRQVGLTHAAAGRFADAVRCLTEHVRLTPTAEGFANLAAACGKLKRWEDAVAAGRRAVELDPSQAAGWSNLGNAYRDLGRLPEAVDALTRGTRADPQNPDNFANLALTLTMLGRTAEALPVYDRAVRLQPNNPEVRFNRAVARLWAGDWAGGWPEYEWRWRTEQMAKARRPFPVPEWDGSPVAGKTVLVHSEQGVGDTFQFLRLVPVLAAAGATVLLDLPPAVRLLARSLGVGTVLDGEAVRAAIHLHCPLMGLPLRLRLTDPDAVPGAVPYLTAPPDRAAHWARRLADLAGLKVGVVWQGNPTHVGDRWRSVPLARFAPLAKPGVTLVSLQKGAGHAQLADAPVPVVDLGAELADDWADTAGLIAALDLLVSIDTAAVHLAGALGRPAWVLLPLNADWRWRQNRDDSPWYPSLRLFRQERFGDWGPVFDRAAAELATRVGGH